MEAIKLSMLAMALTFSIGFAACNDANDDKLIEVEKHDRLIERDNDKVEIDVDRKDGKLDVDVDNDKRKVDVEIGKDKDDRKD